MIDCSTNIIDLINNHPEQVRTALGIGDNDNFIILQPISGEYAGQDCIFTDNRVDDYTGDITAYIIIGLGYEPSTPALIDGGGQILSNALLPLNEDNKDNIYYAIIKGYSCDINSGFFVQTQRKRFWVNGYVCEEGSDLGRVDGGRFVEYGGNVTLWAYPNESDYTVTWTDTSDPETPVTIDSNALTHTINNITRDYSIETCFVVPPAKHTFRVFTNDGKISNLDLDRMVEGYKLGDVRVDFILEGTTYTIDTNNCDYGQIKTFDFNTAQESWINFSSNSEHNLDRGVILYNVPDNISLTVTKTAYSDVCCYTNDCSDTMAYTSFKGFYSYESENDYNDLNSCEMQYPTYAYELYSDDNTAPDIHDSLIHFLSSLPETVGCCDYYFIKVPTGTPNVYNYYQRDTVSDTIYLKTIECYGELDNSETVVIPSLTSDMSYFSIFEPNTNAIKLVNEVSEKVTISIQDYCDCTNTTYIPIPCNEAINPMSYDSIPTVSDYEYIRVGNVCYRRSDYRETGVYKLNGFTDVTINEIVGSKVGILCTGDNDGFTGVYYWDVLFNQSSIQQSFVCEDNCEAVTYDKCPNFYFAMCQSGLTITINKSV